jgi:hypothetical protein
VRKAPSHTSSRRPSSPSGSGPTPFPGRCCAFASIPTMHQPLGEGHVIAFAEDPNYRGYAEVTELLFMNAVLLGPAY